MTTLQDDGGPAFPQGFDGGPYDGGMSLRDWFAGMALQGCIEWERLRGVDELLDDNMPPHSQPLTPGDSIDDGDQSRRVAQSAYNIADAMLAARKEAK